jgi:2',3'-cyclic-nucleotide 2'-phosphodiesterase (5'-nucleotidase family)
MRKFFPLSVFIFLASCSTVYQPSALKYKDYRLNSSSKQNAAINALIKPYADSVNKSMNDIIVVSEVELLKKQPEGNLGNLMADAMLAMAKKKYNMPVDIALINYGGIRLPSIAAGNITRGKIFELAPFDNIIVLQKISGKILLELLNHISGRKGWPAAGVSWQINNGKAQNILVNGKPLDENATYTLSVVDYVANGGDDCTMLKNIAQINNGSLFREAVIEYLSAMNANGQKIIAKTENRVSNVQ